MGELKIAQSFSHTYQKKGEKLSDYVKRLDQIIRQIIMMGGMEGKVATKNLVSQMIRGAKPMDPIVLQFRAQGSSNIHIYSKLKKIIREEEALSMVQLLPNQVTPPPPTHILTL